MHREFCGGCGQEHPGRVIEFESTSGMPDHDMLRELGRRGLLKAVVDDARSHGDIEFAELVEAFPCCNEQSASETAES